MEKERGGLDNKNPFSEKMGVKYTAERQTVELWTEIGKCQIQDIPVVPE